MLKFVFIFILLSTQVFAKEVLRVGFYEFKPYFNTDTNSGLGQTAVSLLNKIQNEYNFKIVTIPAKRRFEALRDNKIDMMMFEDPHWGWQQTPHLFLPFSLVDGEVYVANKTKAMGQEYFDQIQGKTIVGILGFHYAVTDFKDISAETKLDFTYTQVKDPENILELIVKERADIGILPKSFVNGYGKDNPIKAGSFFISKRYDHYYQLGILSSPKRMKIQPKLKALIAQLEKEEAYIAAVAALGIQKTP